MLSLRARLSRNAPEVVGEVIDGEAILINLVTGVYYSLDGVGGLIWTLIETQHSFDEIATAITGRYDVSLEQARTDVQRVASELLREKLVVVSDRKGPGGNGPAPAPQPKQRYEAPQVNVYRDMGDLLALDPPAPGLTDIPWRAPAGGPAD